MSDIYADMRQVYRGAGISLKNACERAYALAVYNNEAYQAYAELLKVEIFLQQKYQALGRGELIMSNEVKTAAYDNQMNRISSKQRVSDEQVRFLESIIENAISSHEGEYIFSTDKKELVQQMKLYRKVFCIPEPEEISENNSISGK